jgi:hypothetical protein
MFTIWQMTLLFGERILHNAKRFANSFDEVILTGSCYIVAIMRESEGIENGQGRIQKRTRL